MITETKYEVVGEIGNHVLVQIGRESFAMYETADTTYRCPLGFIVRGYVNLKTGRVTYAKKWFVVDAEYVSFSKLMDAAWALRDTLVDITRRRFVHDALCNNDSRYHVASRIKKLSSVEQLRWKRKVTRERYDLIREYHAVQRPV